jgi:hypothetical protein
MAHLDTSRISLPLLPLQAAPGLPKVLHGVFLGKPIHCRRKPLFIARHDPGKPQRTTTALGASEMPKHPLAHLGRVCLDPFERKLGLNLTFSVCRVLVSNRKHESNIGWSDLRSHLSCIVKSEGQLSILHSTCCPNLLPSSSFS